MEVVVCKEQLEHLLEILADLVVAAVVMILVDHLLVAQEHLVKDMLAELELLQAPTVVVEAVVAE
ncbi:MAG: hypothetical protein EBT79_15020 [Actinobacteria bacterium]|nr:hypothetical protein [Actinomycetota bacterium]